MSLIFKLFDLIEAAYIDPIDAKVQLLSFEMDMFRDLMIMDDSTDADPVAKKLMQTYLHGLYVQGVFEYAREVTKGAKCYGYAEYYCWNQMLNAGENSMIQDFATNGEARLPTKDEMWEFWDKLPSSLVDPLSGGENFYNKWGRIHLEDLTSGLVDSGLDPHKEFCEMPEKEYEMMPMRPDGPFMKEQKSEQSKPDNMPVLELLKAMHSRPEPAKWILYDQEHETSKNPTLQFSFGG